MRCLLVGMMTPSLVEIPTSAQALIDAWSGFKEAAAIYTASLDSLVADEIRRRGIQAGEKYRIALECREARLNPEKVAERIRRALVLVAEEVFAPPGASLDIPEPSAKEVAGADLEQFDPAAVWEYFAVEYGGGGGQIKAYRDAAIRLGKELNIRVGTEPKMISGRPVLTVSVYGDRIFGRVVSYEDGRMLNAILDGFVAVGEWSGRWSSSEKLDVSWAREDIRRADNSKFMPDRRTLGDDVLIVPFKSKWEFRFAPEFADQLQLFLAEFDGFKRH